MKRRKDNFPVRPLFLSIIIIAIIFIIGYIRKVLTTSDYFKVKGIISREELNTDFSYLKGRNIFTLDLSGESVNIAKKCPDCLRVRLARVLPDHLFVEFIRRRPVALVKLYRYFVVDQYGVFFGSVLNPDGLNLPLVTGLETRLFGITLGKRSATKELILVLSIIKEFNKSFLMRDYQIRRIEVGTVEDITIFIPFDLNKDAYSQWQVPARENILEVRISQGNILEKIAVISGLMNQEKHNLGNIKYIDLRFKEPVIKFKDAK
jgi:cell division septal protein FtsQ